MTVPLANTILGLILVHGISMTMWRALLNSTLPNLSDRSSSVRQILPRFNLQLTNTLPPSDLPTTPMSTIPSPQVSTPSSQQVQQSSSMLTSPSMVQPVLQPIIQIHQIPMPMSAQPPPQMMLVQPASPSIRDSISASSGYSINDQPQRLILQAVHQQYQRYQPAHQSQFIPSTMPIQPIVYPQASTLNPITVRPDLNSIIRNGNQFKSPLDGLLKNHDMTRDNSILSIEEKKSNIFTEKPAFPELVSLDGNKNSNFSGGNIEIL